MTTPTLTRRAVIAGLTGSAALAGCTTSVIPDAQAAGRLDARVDATRDYLLRTYPGTRAMVEGAQGVLYMPLMTEAGLGFGATYGQGALRIGNATVDYYNAASASFGLQAGAQQFAHVLIFQSAPALAAFRASTGWVAAAGAYYALPMGGMALGTDSITLQQPVVALVFGQSGLMAGATIEGTKYSRIVPGTLRGLATGQFTMPQIGLPAVAWPGRRG